VKKKKVKFRGFTEVEQTIGLENSFEMMKLLFTDLRRGSGATVISSAGGAEFAYEGEQWQNGVFTYSLLTGLKEKQADLDQNGEIRLSELQLFLKKRVPELTEGKQQPTSRAVNLTNDFKIE